MSNKKTIYYCEYQSVVSELRKHYICVLDQKLHDEILFATPLYRQLSVLYDLDCDLMYIFSAFWHYSCNLL